MYDTKLYVANNEPLLEHITCLMTPELLFTQIEIKLHSYVTSEAQRERIRFVRFEGKGPKIATAYEWELTLGRRPTYNTSVILEGRGGYFQHETISALTELGLSTGFNDFAPPHVPRLEFQPWMHEPFEPNRDCFLIKPFEDDV